MKHARTLIAATVSIGLAGTLLLGAPAVAGAVPLVAGTPVSAAAAAGASHAASVLELRSHAAYESYVTALYADYLGRNPGVSEVEYWADKLSAGARVTLVSDSFVNSDEFRMIRIREAYQHILHRDVEPAGGAYWLNEMRSGRITTDGIEETLYQSEEFYLIAADRNHANPNDGALVDALWPYILGREVAGFEGFDLLGLGFMKDRKFLVDYVYFSQEAANARVRGMYQRYLGRLPDDLGLALWAGIDLRIGDTATRSGLTSSEEYFELAARRFTF